MFLLRQTTHRQVIQYHPELGHLYVPGLCARIPHENGGYFVRTNALGFRSDAEFEKARGARPRILFFGDSFTAGDGVDNAERFTERVGEALDAEVYNFGLSGSGTDQQLLIYERFARDIACDLVVLCVQVENIERIQARYRESVDRSSRKRVLVAKPYFTLEHGKLQRHHDPVPRERPEAGGAEGRHATSNFPEPLRRFQKQYDQHIKVARPELHQALIETRGRLRRLGLKATGRQPYPDYASADSAGWRLMQAIVERFKAARADVPVLIVPLPTPEYLDGAEPVFQRRFEALADPRTSVLDVTGPLRALAEPERKRLSFPNDVHYSPLGHRHLGRLLAADIGRRVKRPPAPPRARPAPARPAPVQLLGISAWYHDSAAALIEDGKIVAAAQEERFTRIKNDRSYPAQAINYCLEQGRIHPRDLTAVVYYDNAAQTFERIVHSALAEGDQGEGLWQRALPSWLRHKLHIPQIIREQLGYQGTILHDAHHRSHAAAAFYPSPFDDAAILTLDGVGEWATAAIGVGEGNQVRLLQQMEFPSSLGLLYSAFTQFTGFKVNSGEYKMMGLAPYGDPVYVDAIRAHLVEIREDGSLALDLRYFDFLGGARMTNRKFEELFGGPARAPDSRITRREMNLARSIQVITEEVMLRMARHAHALTGKKRLCLAGGVALNCVANGRLLREGPFDDLWIQPAAGDAGSSLGAALDAYHTYFGGTREAAPNGRPAQGGSLLGPEFSESEIAAFLDTHGYPYERLDPSTRADRVAEQLAAGKVVGHFSGRTEFGPRSLGARSILGDPRDPEMQVTLNVKIKYRESFRPFAPSVLREKAGEYFELDGESPYMLLVAAVKPERCLPFDRGSGEDMLEIVRMPRSDIPAVTHIDNSARVQTVDRADHPAYHDVIRAFERRTGCAVIVNTSFNVRGEPIVNTPYDAYRCFMRTEMDVLVLGNHLLRKEGQPVWPEPKGHVEASEDATAKASGDADPLAPLLGRVFREQVLPLARRLDAADQRIHPRPQDAASTWRPTEPWERRMFVIPGALDQSSPEPARMAQAITEKWQPGLATEALRPVLEALLTLVDKNGARVRGEPLREEVSTGTYVMF